MDPLEKPTPFTIPEMLEVILSYTNTETRREAAPVCRNFYDTICHLERNKSLKLRDNIMDDEIFESMLHSSRRFKEITVDSCYGNEGSKERALRIGAVLGKFKNRTKKLVVSPFPLCSRGISSPTMEAMSEVEELSLNWNDDNTIDTKGCFDLQKDFQNLKNLNFCGDYESSGILDKVPDNTLETLSLSLRYDARRPNQEYLQAFLDRQKNIKELTVPEGLKLELSHLKLEELTLDVDDDKWLAKVLQQQQTLRILLSGAFFKRSVASIGSSSFIELQKLRNLEVLRGSFSKNMRGQLANLKELRVLGDASIVLQVAFPKLKTLKVVEWGEFDEETHENITGPHSLGPEHIIALSRRAPNLQDIAIKNNRIDSLPAIIENFPKLVTLRLEPLAGGALNFPPPNRQNLSIKQLSIVRQVYGHEVPDAAICQTIAMCPNLERIYLGRVVFTEQQILNLIESHPRLTHFNFRFVENNLFGEREADLLDPRLMQIIQIFRNSPAFVLLRFSDIADCREQLVEDALEEDADHIEVTKSSIYHGTCDLSLRKKVEDPFKGFYYGQFYFREK